MELVKRFFTVVWLCLTVGGAGAVFAASNNGCDNGDNDRITPELALCSTHVYNIGETKNIPSSSSDKQLMRDVVALKTTVMTQQMNKQYEYLEAMIRRFKTQLEKAVLTTSLQAKGASSTSSSSSGSSARNVMLGEDCSGKNRTDTVYCLRNNYAKMAQVAASKQYTNELREQIVRDANAIRWFDSSLKPNLCGTGNDDKDTKCCFTKSYLDKNTIQQCLGQINGAIIKIEEGGQRQNQKQQ